MTKKEPMDSLGTKIRHLRAAQSISQVEAAKKIGIEQSYLSKLESDQAWASVDVLRRICKTYRTDINSLLRQVDQRSLRGNLEYQGLLLRSEARRKKAWILASFFSFLTCILALSILHYREQSEVQVVHTTISIKLEQVNGKDVLEMIAELAGLTIDGVDEVRGQVTFLHLKNEPRDSALAHVANELGYRIEILGSQVKLIPTPKIDLKK